MHLNFAVTGEATMQFCRRNFLQLAGAAAVAATLPQHASALDYPAQPVHLIVPYAPAGGTDILARLIGQHLSKHLGQQFIVENRPGGNSNLGTEAVARAPADGYTLLVVDNAPAINATLYEKLNFNFIRDIAPVAGIATQPVVMEVNPSFPAKTVPEFIAYAKANPGKINFASAGIGNATHLSGELFKMMTGTDMVHVPYRGTGPALTDLLGGHVQVMFGSLLASIEYIRAGRLRALAVSSAKRLAALPGVPTLSEFLPDYEVSAWYGVGVPRGTPTEIVEELNTAINFALADPVIKDRVADMGATVLLVSPGQFGTLIANDTAKWVKVVKFSGAKAD
jgi:tripartite-type tricarboxylate transporter receptor subunit TctC